MAILSQIQQGLLWAAAAWLAAHGMLVSGSASQQSNDACDLPPEAVTGQEGAGQTQTPEGEEGQRSSEPTAPSAVLALQFSRVDLAQPRRISSHDKGGYCRNDDPHSLGCRPVDSLESAVRLNHSLAMDFATRVPQLWRHAPPA